MYRLPLPCCLTFAALIVVAFSVRSVPAEESNISFTKQQLDTKFRSEGAGVGDFNRDGKPDIAAGRVWYEAPDWKMHSIVETAPEHEPKSYSHSFCTFARDLNADGWQDLIVVDFPGTPTWWFENPRGESELWKQHTLAEVTNNESPQLYDLDGDGRSEFLLATNSDKENPDSDSRVMAFATAGKAPGDLWDLHVISDPAAPGTKKYDHGLGAGDLNGDGRADVVVPGGWWEAPAENAQATENARTTTWKFHHVGLIPRAAQIYVYDFDEDKDADLLCSNPHDYGIWWLERTGAESWEKHEIDMTYSQTHSLCVADINSDGLPDFVTGKRWWAHGGNDPGGDEAAVMCWYELTRRDGKPHWIRHQFDHDSGVGTQFEVADVNGDGLLDVVTSNKKGVFLFTQSREK